MRHRASIFPFMNTTPLRKPSSLINVSAGSPSILRYPRENETISVSPQAGANSSFDIFFSD